MHVATLYLLWAPGVAAGYAPFGAWTEAQAGNNNEAILWQWGSLKF